MKRPELPASSDAMAGVLAIIGAVAVATGLAWVARELVGRREHDKK